MPIEVLMPALSPTMTEGNVAKWVKKEGDKVSPGDVIAEIETDKATMEVEAVDGGILGKIIMPEGSAGVPVNQLIAFILEEGEDPGVLESLSSNRNDKPIAAACATKEAASPAVQPTVVPLHVTGSTDKRILASPLAKRIAAQEGVNLTQVKGTGPHGRVVKQDVLASMQQRKPAAQLTVQHGTRHPEEYVKIPNTTMRKVIAKRLCESKQTVPHFYLSLECELTKLLHMRSEMNQAVQGENSPYKLSVNDFIIKAVAMALKRVPAANASWTDEAILRYTHIDVAVAVALEGGLITPIIRNADHKSLSALSNEMKELANRARGGKLQPEEFQGGGFSISNLGMYGIKQFNAIINPPQSCILAIGAGNERAVVRGGNITVAQVMDVTLSSDHRVVDGAVGAEFLAAFKGFIENPVTMLA